MLTTASFYDSEHHRGELFRISVGSPRGQIRRWSDLSFLYPTREVVQAYRGGNINAEEYRRRYVDLLEERWTKVKEWLDSLEADKGVTLLCFEKEGEFCHRRLVAELAQRERPDILVELH